MTVPLLTIDYVTPDAARAFGFLVLDAAAHPWHYGILGDRVTWDPPVPASRINRVPTHGHVGTVEDAARLLALSDRRLTPAPVLAGLLALHGPAVVAVPLPGQLSLF